MAGLPSVFARAWLAWCLAELGDFQEGIIQGEEAVAIAESADDAYSRVLAAWVLGTLHVVRGDGRTRLERARVGHRAVSRSPKGGPRVSSSNPPVYYRRSRFTTHLPADRPREAVRSRCSNGASSGHR